MPRLLDWFAQGWAATMSSPQTSPDLLDLPDDSPALMAENLVRGFGDGASRTLAVNQVNLSLNRGQLTLLMGPSGSGKSTLLALISGLMQPDSGRVVALGRDLGQLSAGQQITFRRDHCGYIFQGANLLPALTARQQLELILRWTKSSNAAANRKRADRLLDRLGLTDRAHLRPMALSGGEKQRVAIARALIKQPTFIFADEPTSALDWENGRQVADLLADCAHSDNAAVLVVTHDPRLVAYADRVIEMADGRAEEVARETVAGHLHAPIERHGPRTELHDPAYA